MSKIRRDSTRFEAGFPRWKVRCSTYCPTALCNGWIMIWQNRPKRCVGWSLSDVKFPYYITARADTSWGICRLLQTISKLAERLDRNSKKKNNSLAEEDQPQDDAFINQNSLAVYDVIYSVSSINYQGFIDIELNCGVAQVSAVLTQQ